jgi:DNA mismatch repair protein MutL
MASVRESLGRFNIVPSLDFESGAIIDIPVKNPGDPFPKQPDIQINPHYNPFNGDESSYRRPGFFERFERENAANWEKLYSTTEKENDGQGHDPVSETGRKFFQIKNKYIVCPVKSGLMFIDQKRAHERILYEKYLECLSLENALSQTELFPLVVELNPADIQVLKEMVHDLKLLGFTLSFSGSGSVTITGRPSNSASSDPAAMLGIFIEEFKATQNSPLAGEKEKLAAAMAGASAIPYGKTLVPGEMEDLFDTLFACSSPNYSPKGKPVISIITLEELDKRFR